MNVTILGAGPGGYVCAIKCAQLGAQVTLIDSHEVGGTCLHWGCIPTKSINASIEVLSKIRHSEDFGIELKGDAIPNLSRIIDRKDKIVATLVKGIRGLLKSHSINVVIGRGKLISPYEIEVVKPDKTTEIIKSDKIVIATGSSPADIPSLPFDSKHILSSTDALALRQIPKSITIIGAGVIGCEFATIFSELGTDVTIIEMMPRCLITEDEEIAEILTREFKKKRIKLLTGVKVIKSEIKENHTSVSLEDGREIVSEKVLVSVGRRINSDGIGLEEVGIQIGKRGEIIVNEMMQTNIPSVFAIGDVVGGMLLAHVASTEGIVCAYNVCGIKKTIDYSVVPATIFTSPEIGSVGLREFECKQRGIDYNKGYFHFRGLGKAQCMGEIVGMVKVITQKDSDKIIGMHVIGPHASDLIHEGAIAIKHGLTSQQVANTIHSHPTLSEAIMEAMEDVHSNAIHIPKK
ncbi:MAG: dihydrolipoyl dehydrogenase [Thermodesulfovibrionales bacterium]|nr:dihydrolipoyl dehydrogenase [Thermodesulfovibrionales bacterium]